MLANHMWEMPLFAQSTNSFCCQREAAGLLPHVRCCASTSNFEKDTSMKWCLMLNAYLIGIWWKFCMFSLNEREEKKEQKADKIVFGMTSRAGAHFAVSCSRTILLHGNTIAFGEQRMQNGTKQIFSQRTNHIRKVVARVVAISFDNGESGFSWC